MVNQRAAIRMSEAEVAEFLAGRHSMSVATLGPDGAVHLVAMWYGLVEGRICFETKAKSQKVQNLRRDPRLTVLVETGSSYGELRGVELVGRASISDDPDELFAVGRSVFDRYIHPYSDELRPQVEAMLVKRVAVFLEVSKTVSWDHSKLA